MINDIEREFDDLVDQEDVYVVTQAEWNRLKKLEENIKKLIAEKIEDRDQLDPKYTYYHDKQHEINELEGLLK